MSVTATTLVSLLTSPRDSRRRIALSRFCSCSFQSDRRNGVIQKRIFMNRTLVAFGVKAKTGMFGRNAEMSLASSPDLVKTRTASAKTIPLTSSAPQSRYFFSISRSESPSLLKSSWVGTTCLSASSATVRIVRADSIGYFPFAVSPESIIASVCCSTE